jgi:2-amino-4-hydroxy-6-hydroxymethyldihydropteridine diphosphokinase
MEVGLGLGSNLGDRPAHLAAAKARIAALPGVRLLAASSLYETEPVGVKPEYQHLKFINAALIITTALPLNDLHRSLLDIEAAIGRARTSDKFAPRPLDIDILFAGTLVLDTPTLKLPHPQCLKRRFVLEPLAELVPERVLAPTGLTIRQLLDALPNPEPVVRLDTAW